MNTRDAALNRLKQLIDEVPVLIAAIPGDIFEQKQSREKWSKKEILGHLIDSATNNHQRLVKAQFQDNPRIVYEQVQWVTGNAYQFAERAHLLAFWTIYNQHIYHLVAQLQPAMLQRTCNTGGPENITLEALFVDYIHHMEHHIKQLVDTAAG
jgi:hypothetical protein